ncbi:MAG: class I SAM-dependent methyltransferase [Arsenophonus endosymbiont of Dermacentor nuttalli]
MKCIYLAVILSLAQVYLSKFLGELIWYQHYFSHIEMIQGNNYRGKILDSGTGVNSLSWISQLKSESWTAVTCAINMKEEVQQIISGLQRPQDRLLLGNWADVDFMVNERFDTVIADYLLGAVEGFVPYWQIPLLYRLKALTLNRLYFTGLEPYVPYKCKLPSGTYCG